MLFNILVHLTLMLVQTRKKVGRTNATSANILES